MTDALENHEGSVSIGGRTITNLRFADDIDALVGKEDELVKLINHLDTTSSKYGMEISAEKTKLMTNNTKGISLHVRIGGQKLETVQSFKYLGSVVTDEGSKQEIMSRIAQTIGALTKLKAIWKDKNIALSSKIRLMRSLVISIFLYACETWTLTAELEKKIQTTEMRCFRGLLGISYRDHVTNEKVGNRSRQAIGPYEDLLTTVKKRKLRWYGHKTRSTGLAKMILQGTVQGGRRRGRQKKRWEDNITEWTGLKLGEALRKAENREEWRTVVDRSSLVPQRSNRLWDKWSEVKEVQKISPRCLCEAWSRCCFRRYSLLLSWNSSWRGTVTGLETETSARSITPLSWNSSWRGTGLETETSARSITPLSWNSSWRGTGLETETSARSITPLSCARMPPNSKSSWLCS